MKVGVALLLAVLAVLVLAATAMNLSAILKSCDPLAVSTAVSGSSSELLFEYVIRGHCIT